MEQIENRLLNEKEAAIVLGLKTKTMQQWRFYSKGPKFLKLGKAVRYRMADLQKFMEECVINPVV